MPQSIPATHHSWIYRRAVLPILALLRIGATPERLAWSIALGLLIGVNPIIGTTTVLSIALALLFRLNLIAAQVANHAVFPLEIVLVIPTIRLGARVFHTAPMPLSAHSFVELARHAPLALGRQLWVWEWHAFVVWAAIAVVTLPAVAAGLTPVLRAMLTRIQRHQYPIITMRSDDVN